MLVYDHYRYTGTKQRWVVPKGVTEALFECWGAAGGMPSSLAWEGKKRQVVGGTGPKNNAFYNNPSGQGQLGHSFANGSGYALGVKAVTEGDVYYVFVGGNGDPGHSTIKLKDDGNYEVSFRGGAGGYNGGGDGGQGAHVYQNLYNGTDTKVHFRRNSMPSAAKAGQLWYDTGSHVVKKCNTSYTSGNGTTAKWDQVTHEHDHAAGPSGGGGGGATDIRYGGDSTSDRILVAGGGGGAAGPYNTTGAGSWALHRVPGTPAPPFGTDTVGTGATGPDSTWCTSVNYLSGSWGLGGIGGGSGPAPNTSTTTDTGSATIGGSGGASTARHKDGTQPNEVHGSGGHGGGALVGGPGGNGGNSTAGSKGQGGAGADAAGGYDDWCAGGGGGGGGYYGGGGGGQGFKVTGHNSGIHTRGGGGGGGSNYADPAFTQVILAAAAQPPFSKSNSGTGANGHGGFARVTYRLQPEVSFKTAPVSVAGGDDFDVVFDYTPAQPSGAAIDHYIIGTASDPNATFPTTQTTIMVTDPTLTEFTHTFTAPAAAVQEAYFVQVVDTDGDASDWLKVKVTGLAASSTTPVTITAPAAGSTFEDSATIDWSIGTQTPLVAYKIGLSGLPHATALKPTPVEYAQSTGWRRGGSRVNLALDPGFVGTAVWSSTSNTNLATSTDHPGVSGHCGKIVWSQVDDFSAEQHTATLDNLIAGVEYRLHLLVSSSLADDKRDVQVQVWDDSGVLAHTQVDLSTLAAGTYATVDLPFVPHRQGAYVEVIPSSSGIGDADPFFTEDFEDGTIGTWTALNGHTLTADTAESYNGDTALKIAGTNAANQGAQKDITALLTAGAGDYVLQGWGWSPTTANHPPTMRISGSGVTGPGLGQGSSISDWDFIRFPFHWDGTGTVLVQLDGDGSTSFGGKWYDVIEAYALDDVDEPNFGCTDSGQVTYLADMLVELTTQEDSGGYQAYFDGSHLNGLTGSVSWEGTANASPSFLTGTDVVTDTVTYTGKPLLDGALTVTTLAQGAVADGYYGAEATVSVAINPTPPATPTVTLTVDSATGLMVLTVNANDSGQSSTNKTVSFDIFRSGTRIVTGLTPDDSTREATYNDVPASGETATYVVRAWSQGGGYADQADGTVN